MSEETIVLQEGMAVEFTHNEETLSGIAVAVPDDGKVSIKAENGRTYKRNVEDLVVITPEEEDDAPADESAPAEEPAAEENFGSVRGMELGDVQLLSINVNRANGKVVIVGNTNDGQVINQTFAKGATQRVSVDISIE